MSLFFTFNAEDGYYAMTKTGYIGLVAVVVIALLLTAIAADRKQKEEGGSRISARQLAFCGVSLALAFVLSSVPFLKFHMPWGGSVTLFTMFMICFVGYLYGVRVGLLTAFAYSLLQFWDGATYVLSPFQACCDYILAFTVLGIAGLWMGKKYGMVVGYIVACLLRGLFHTIGGYLYWMDYMPDDFPQSLAKIYPIAYNYSYILVEMVLTLIVINLPPVKSMLIRIKKIAVGE